MSYLSEVLAVEYSVEQTMDPAIVCYWKKQSKSEVSADLIGRILGSFEY